MSRYIDYDAIDYRNARLHDKSEEFLNGVIYMAQRIEYAPSIDIVRCKECKHWIGETEHYEDREYKACRQLCGQYMNSEFWCKYGEREGE